VDYGVSSTDCGLDLAGCTGCKSRESSAVARCFDCSNFLCANCVMAHQFMHCFEGHHVTTLGEITSNSGTHHVQELDAVNKMISEGKLKANEIRNNLKNLETTSTRLAGQYQKALSEVNETYQFYVSMLDERRAEIARELEQAYSSKQVALSVYSQKAQETVDKIFQVTDFIERLMKHASNGEVLLFKKPLDARLHQLLSYTPELNMSSLTELEFISNFQAIQVGVKNQFGYVKSKPESGGGNKQQPPISRPVPSPLPPPQELGQLNSMVRGLLDQRGYGNQFESASLLSKRFSQSVQSPAFHSPQLSSSHLSSPHLSSPHLTSPHLSSPHLTSPHLTSPHLSSPHLSSPHLSSLLHGSSIAELTGGNGLNVPVSNGLGGLSAGGLNPYEKWSNGSDSLFGLTPTPQPSQQDAFKDRLSISQPPSDMIDLTSKFMSSTNLSPAPMTSGSPLYPPKSQIKRQKMIYHCKFGEFGILEGQFTEPSGVAVNAQNDIIVADTNNHRIQIFDKEGRFKFQFGEVGKRDGQLLYPNRVAVVKNSGDIIVTERSPTHQIQIYNQYGQFVRKFGANILQHPRGVCVDNKGRIVVVECKVMRVIIFDQFGNVLNKFGCSKHLEFPNGVVVNDRQEIFISDNRAHCVKVFDYEGNFLRQIGGEGITNYPIGVGINGAGEITIADNHNNFNLSVFSQDGQLISALESKVKHAQCFDVALMDDGSVVLASKDYRLYIYRYIQVPPVGM
jgi:tripartite motif-containing protein 2/3